MKALKYENREVTVCSGYEVIDDKLKLYIICDPDIGTHDDMVAVLHEAIVELTKRTSLCPAK